MRAYWRSVVGIRVASWLADQPDLVMVGRLGGAPALGLYDTARRWAWYPFSEPFLALTDVAVVSFSRVRAEPDRFRRFVTRGVLVMLSVSLPVIAFIGAEADAFVRVLLGSQWGGAVPFLRILSLATFGGALSRVVQWIPLAAGDARRLLRWFVWIQVPVLTASIAVGTLWGALGVARAFAVAHLMLALPAIAFNVHGTPVRFTDIASAAARPALASVCGVLVLVFLRNALPHDPGGVRLAAALSVYAVAIATAWLALPGGVSATREIVVALREFRREPLTGD
jgi:PST family polysaccharide transporter